MNCIFISFPFINALNNALDGFESSIAFKTILLLVSFIATSKILFYQERKKTFIGRYFSREKESVHVCLKVYSRSEFPWEFREGSNVCYFIRLRLCPERFSWFMWFQFHSYSHIPRITSFRHCHCHCQPRVELQHHEKSSLEFMRESQLSFHRVSSYYSCTKSNIVHAIYNWLETKSSQGL